MSLPLNAYDAATAASVTNQQFQPAAAVLARKGLIIGTYLPAKTGITNYTPAQVQSPTDAGNTYGFGSMIHRMVTAFFAGMATAGNQIPVYVSPDSETNISGATAATGTLTITVSSPLGGTYALYIDNISYATVIPATPTPTPTSIAAAIVATIALDPNCPVTAAAVAGVITFTAKSKGLWGNFITLALNLGATDASVSGVTSVFVAMSSGAGTNSVSIAAALAALGSNDGANAAGFTDIVHGYHQDQLVITAIGTYCGLGNTAGGLYAPTVHKPFRCLQGDTVAGSTGFTNLQALSLTNNQDRCNGIVWAPGSMTHPEEIAANAMGYMASINSIRAEQMYVGAILAGVDPGNVAAAAATRLTDIKTNRTLAVASGISPTQAQGGYLTLLNVITFYAPANVPATSNGYREMRNISVLQNILYNVWLNFAQPKWQGCSIVKDTKAVTNTTSRQKARSLDDIRDDWIALVTGFYGNAWIYSTDMPLAALASTTAPAITIRPAGDGFTSQVPMILSGIGNVLDNGVTFDIAIPTS